MASFSSSHLKKIANIILINFSGLQQEVSPIFKLLKSTEAWKVMTENQAYCGFLG